MPKGKQVPTNYDYTAKERVDRKRQALKDAGGKRVEAFLDAGELDKLDAFAETIGMKDSRRGALKYMVQQLPAPKKKKA